MFVFTHPETRLELVDVLDGVELSELLFSGCICCDNLAGVLKGEGLLDLICKRLPFCFDIADRAGEGRMLPAIETSDRLTLLSSLSFPASSLFIPLHDSLIPVESTRSLLCGSSRNNSALPIYTMQLVKRISNV